MAILKEVQMDSLKSVAIEYPFTAGTVEQLKAGQFVSLSGRIVTCRDRAMQYLVNGGKSNVDLKNVAIYNCGPLIIWNNGKWIVRSAGPTTSSRTEMYIQRFLDQFHCHVIIGKGGIKNMHKISNKYKCVYMELVGGTAALVADRIIEVKDVYFLKEFGSAEAMWDMVVKDLMCVVVTDISGHDLHRKVEIASRRRLNHLIESCK